MVRGSSRLVTAVVLVALAGCGSDDSAPTSGEPAVASPPTTVAPSPTGTWEPVTDFDAPADLPSLVDTSTEAQQTFLVWVDYEAEGSSQGAAQDLAAGYAVCVWRSQGVLAEAIEGRLASEMAYLGSGPQAIQRAALVALCPEYDLTYRTDLDKHVVVYEANLAALMQLTPQPPFYEYGRMLTAVCEGMKDRTIAGLPIIGYIKERLASGQLSLVSPATEDHYVIVLIHQAVIVHCSGLIYALPPEVMNEPNS